MRLEAYILPHKDKMQENTRGRITRTGIQKVTQVTNLEYLTVKSDTTTNDTTETVV